MAHIVNLHSNGWYCTDYTIKCAILTTVGFWSDLSGSRHVLNECDLVPVGGAGGWPPVPKLARAVQCLSLNRTALLLEPGYNCTKMLDWFAEVYAALIGCFLENAHPTCLCEACLPFYREVHKIYGTIKSWDSNQKDATKYYVDGHRCTENLLYGSKLGVLQSALGFAENLWQSAACECKKIDKAPVMLVWLAKPSHYMFRGLTGGLLGWFSMPDECPATLYVFRMKYCVFVCTLSYVYVYL